MKKRNKINIKKSKVGTFTKAAKKAGMSVQDFAKKILANKHNYSSAMIKKANFTITAAKWEKKKGGPVKYQKGKLINVPSGSFSKSEDQNLPIPITIGKSIFINDFTYEEAVIISKQFAEYENNFNNRSN